MCVIHGAHFLIYSADAEADRVFLRDVLGFPCVELDRKWLIFALPPSEIAVHPGGSEFRQQHAAHPMQGIVLYLMCGDIAATVDSLKAKGIACAPVDEAPWGIHTAIPLPSGGWIGLYQPTHPTAIQR